MEEKGPQPKTDAEKPKSRHRGFAPGNPWRFALGQGGRQPGAPDKANKLSEAYGEALDKLVEDGSITRAQAIAERMAHIATAGKPGAAIIAAKELADRTEGKPMQAIQISQVIDAATALQLAKIAEMLVRNPRQIPVLEAEIVEEEEPSK